MAPSTLEERWIALNGAIVDWCSDTPVTFRFPEAGYIDLPRDGRSLPPMPKQDPTREQRWRDWDDAEDDEARLRVYEDWTNWFQKDLKCRPKDTRELTADQKKFWALASRAQTAEDLQVEDKTLERWRTKQQEPIACGNPDCGKAFMPQRSTRKYCSKACTNRASYLARKQAA